MKIRNLAIDESASHGFSRQLIDDVVIKCESIFTIEDLLSDFLVFSVENALKIIEVIQELFLHIPSLEETLALFGFWSNVDSNAWFSLEDCIFSDSDDDWQV